MTDLYERHWLVHPKRDGDRIRAVCHPDAPGEWERLGYTVTGPYESLEGLPFAVGEPGSILGRFATHNDAARFIDTLPEHETGRYFLDGPEQRND